MADTTYEEDLGAGYFEYPALKGQPSHLDQSFSAAETHSSYHGDPRKPNDGTEFEVQKGYQPGVDYGGIPLSSG